MYGTRTLLKRERKLLSLFDRTLDLKILVINVEAFSTKKGVTFVDKFINTHFPLIAVDESTTIKILKHNEPRTF